MMMKCTDVHQHSALNIAQCAEENYKKAEHMNHKYFRFLFSYINALIVGISVGIEQQSVFFGIGIGMLSMYAFDLLCLLVLDD